MVWTANLTIFITTTISSPITSLPAKVSWFDFKRKRKAKTTKVATAVSIVGFFTLVIIVWIVSRKLTKRQRERERELGPVAQAVEDCEPVTVIQEREASDAESTGQDGEERNSGRVVQEK